MVVTLCLVIVFVFGILSILWQFTNSCLLNREESSERFERAAAIAVFQGDLPRANSSLREGAMSATKKGDTLRGTLFVICHYLLSN